MLSVEEQINSFANEVLHGGLTDIQQLSSGAYSNVYKALRSKDGREVVIKQYYKNGFMLREISELDALRKLSGLPVPQVFGYCQGSDESPDTFFMELMPGVPVRYAHYETESEKHRIADAVVDAHLSLHKNINPEGFGDLDCPSYTPNWEELYKSRIDGYYQYLSSVKDSPLTPKAREYIDEAYENTDMIFCQPVKEARLIHGDFKMKNILIDPHTFKITALLDPMGGCFGDRESDLFPYINHPEDVKFELLDNYAGKVKLSDQFPLKNLCYFLWNEVKLYVYMGYCMNDAYEEIGTALHNMLKYGC